MNNRWLCFLVFASLLSSGVWANAELVFSSTIQADFQFEIVEGPLSAIDGVNVGDIIPFQALGTMTFTLDDSVPDATSMSFLDATGTLMGVAPGPFLPFELTPDVEFVGGSLDDIVRDGTGEIISANVVGLSMLWEMYSNPAILGGVDVVIYAPDPLEFNGSVTGIPFGVGDVLAGPEAFEVYLDEGLGNPGLPGGDPLVAIGSNRTLTAVPEPGSFAFFTAISGLLLCRRRKC